MKERLAVFRVLGARVSRSIWHLVHAAGMRRTVSEIVFWSLSHAILRCLRVTFQILEYQTTPMVQSSKMHDHIKKQHQQVDGDHDSSPNRSTIQKVLALHTEIFTRRTSFSDFTSTEPFLAS